MDTAKLTIKMPTINRLCIYESDPETVLFETVEIPQNFSELILGK
jgi:hypothetical protein